VLFGYSAFSQDGLYYFNQNGRKDTIVSLYNSSVPERIPIGDTLVTRIKKNQIDSDGDFFLLLKSGTEIKGKIFVKESRKYILFDLYIEVINYTNGNYYSAKRFLKPED